MIGTKAMSDLYEGDVVLWSERQASLQRRVASEFGAAAGTADLSGDAP
jgi:hypothetical protein